MKSAREMFEELGYECDITDNAINYWIYVDCEDMIDWYCSIYFDLCEHKVYAVEDWESMHIDMPTFKAIQKQLEELGWLDESKI